MEMALVPIDHFRCLHILNDTPFKLLIPVSASIDIFKLSLDNSSSVFISL